MDYEDVKARLLRHWAHTGGPNEHIASELYHDDALLEFPQSGERFRGRSNITAWRSEYPARLEFEPRSIRGEGEFWLAEGLLRYNDGDPMQFVKIIHFRADLDERETIYITETWPPAAARTQYAEGSPLESTPGLPLRVRGGT
jgi:hypothetical protein